MKTLRTLLLLSLFTSLPALADDAKRPAGGPLGGAERAPNPTIQADREKLREDRRALREDREKLHADQAQLRQDRKERREEHRAKRKEHREGKPPKP